MSVEVSEGCRAVLVGLARAELNGKVVRVLGPADDSGRHPVRILAGQGVESKSPLVRLGMKVRAEP